MIVFEKVDVRLALSHNADSYFFMFIF